MTQRILVSDEYRVHGDVASYSLFDSRDGTLVVKHEFPIRSASAPWLRANRLVAQAIADAMNWAPQGAIEQVRKAQRSAVLSRGGDAMGLSLQAA